MRLLKRKIRPEKIEVHAHKAIIKDGQLVISGLIYSNISNFECRLVVRKFRVPEYQYETSVSIMPMPIQQWRGRELNYWRKNRCNVYKFSCHTSLPWTDLPSSIYTIELEIYVNTSPGHTIKVKRGIALRAPFTEVLATIGEDAGTVHLFKDKISRTLRIELFPWGKDDLEMLKTYAKNPDPVGSLVPCLIGELPNSVKDNGLWLFELLRPNKFGVDPTLVVERLNTENYSVDQPNVVAFGSVEHIKKCIDTPVLAFTHNRADIYPLVLKKIAPEQFETVKEFWIQHGVIALKHNIVKYYKKSLSNFHFVAVSSTLEQSFLVESFGYDQDQVKVVGLARHDNLLKLSQEAKTENRILIFPTWRNVITSYSDHNFMRTKFFIEWIFAMQALRERTGMKIVFMVHPMFNHFKHLFEPYADEVFLSDDFQSEVVRASCLVTDYSSVCFDAMYANIPVAFFHFDAKRYGFEKGALIDVETQMPGPIAENVEELVENVGAFKEQNWSAAGSEYQKLYFDNIDQNNAARIAAVIRDAANS